MELQNSVKILYKEYAVPIAFPEAETEGENDASDGNTFEAKLVPYGEPDGEKDIILEGAFGEIQPQIPMLFSHDRARVIGQWKQFKDSSQGLYASGTLTDSTADAREVRALISEGLINGVSVGFGVVAENFDKDYFMNEDGGYTFAKAKLFEASIVTFPSFNGARILNGIEQADGRRELVRDASTYRFLTTINSRL